MGGGVEVKWGRGGAALCRTHKDQRVAERHDSASERTVRQRESHHERLGDVRKEKEICDDPEVAKIAKVKHEAGVLGLGDAVQIVSARDKDDSLGDVQPRQYFLLPEYAEVEGDHVGDAEHVQDLVGLAFPRRLLLVVLLHLLRAWG